MINDFLRQENDFKELCSKDINSYDSTISEFQREMQEDFNPLTDYTFFINSYSNMKNSVIELLGKTEIKIQNLEKAKKYSLMPFETILLRSFDCTYSMLNPILKIKQTQTRTFYFDQELAKILSSSDIKK